jgi:hypothetical protein
VHCSFYLNKNLMKKVIKLYLLIIILISLSYCKTPVKECHFELKKDVLNLSIDSVTSNISDGIQAFSTPTKSYLFSASWSSNSISMYDLAGETLTKKIVFQRQGPNAIGDLFGFYVHNLDSIFLFPQLVPQIFIADTSGLVYSTIEYAPPESLSVAFVHNGYFLSPPIINGNKLYLKTHLLGNYMQVSNAVLNQTPLFYSIDMSSGEVTTSNSNYPANYLRDGFRFFEYSMASSNGRLVFSFFGDHNLFYLEDFTDYELNDVSAPSKFLSSEMEIFNVGGEIDPSSVYEYLFASERYESVIYDQFRNVFYRVAVHSAAFENMNDLRELKNAADRFSVQLLNSDLQVMGEHLLEPKRYLNGIMFVSDKGLYISTNHPKNEDSDENYMRFDLLKFEVR